MEKNSSLFRLLPAILMTMFGLSACEKIIDISIPDKERKMVVNGLVSPGEPVRINLSRSLSVLEKDSLVPIIGGDVRLFLGTELIGKFQEGTGGFYTLPDFKPQAGQTYRLTASSGEMEPVEATATPPPMVPIISLDTTMLTDDWGQTTLRVSVKFNDIAGIRNNYSIGADLTYKEYDYSAQQYTGNLITWPAYLETDHSDEYVDDEFMYFEEKIFFEDLLFDGLERTVEFGISNYNYFESDTVWLNIQIDQIEQSYYTYVKSFLAYQDANGNPFSEPVQVYSNIKGGYGIFSGCSSTRFPIVTHGNRKFR